jgi:hypothetical protein
MIYLLHIEALSAQLVIIDKEDERIRVDGWTVKAPHPIYITNIPLKASRCNLKYPRFDR